MSNNILSSAQLRLKRCRGLIKMPNFLKSDKEQQPAPVAPPAEPVAPANMTRGQQRLAALKASIKKTELKGGHAEGCPGSSPESTALSASQAKAQQMAKDAMAKKKEREAKGNKPAASVIGGGDKEKPKPKPINPVPAAAPSKKANTKMGSNAAPKKVILSSKGHMHIKLVKS
ncbi:hypothetical protein [Rufibacter immobilis]|uniref:hypothetical protein n=1 Tax=Rufibacter immobilis TaxID=1348778 RepID=UPI0035E848E8